jgi:hypothetical protein
MNTNPARGAIAVTPSDVTLLVSDVKALYVGGAGDIAVNMRGSTTTVTFSGCSAGQLLPVQVDRVLATGTTATNIVALY